MDEQMSRMLCAGTQMERGQNLGAGIDGQPQKDAPVWSGAAVCEFRLTGGAGCAGCGRSAHGRSERACASEPSRDGDLSKAEDPCGGGRIQSFSLCREHHCDLVRRSFQAIQGCVTSSSERGVASRTSKGLDSLGLTMFAIADQGVDVSIGVAEVGALSIGIGVALGVDPLRCSPAAFHFAPGAHKMRKRSTSSTAPTYGESSCTAIQMISITTISKVRQNAVR